MHIVTALVLLAAGWHTEGPAVKGPKHALPQPVPPTMVVMDHIRRKKRLASTVLLLLALCQSTLGRAGAYRLLGVNQQTQQAVTSGEELLSVVETLLSQPGPPVDLLLTSNVSAPVGPRPLRVARNVTLHGDGPPLHTELSLGGLLDSWQLDPGVVVTLKNLTLSNLALRSPDAEAPPPANTSVFTFPLWFFHTDR